MSEATEEVKNSLAEIPYICKGIRQSSEKIGVDIFFC